MPPTNKTQCCGMPGRRGRAGFGPARSLAILALALMAGPGVVGPGALAQGPLPEPLVSTLNCEDPLPESDRGSHRELEFLGARVVSKQVDVAAGLKTYTIIDNRGCFMVVEAMEFSSSGLGRFVDLVPDPDNPERYWPTAWDRVVKNLWQEAAKGCAARPLILFSGTRAERERDCRADVMVQRLKSGLRLSFWKVGATSHKRMQVILFDGRIEGYGISHEPLDGDGLDVADEDFGRG